MDKINIVSLMFPILLTGSLICGCSVKEFRSPIVFRSPVVLEEHEPHESPGSPKTSSQSEETDGSKQPSSHPQPPYFQDNLAALPDEGVKNYSQEKYTGEALDGKTLHGSVTKEGETPMEEIQAAYHSDNIPIFSFNDLFHLNFKMLGQVSIRCSRAGKCFTRDEAVNALKMEASKKYGSAAMGLVNVRLEKKPRIFFYTKGRKNISTPEESDTYHKGSAEVVLLTGR